MAAGKFPNIEDLITRKIALKDLVEQGMEVLVKEKDTQGLLELGVTN